MKQVQRPALLVLAIGLFFFVSCESQPVPNNSSVTNPVQTATVDERTNQPDNSQSNQTNGASSNEVIETVEGPMSASQYQQAKDAALAYAAKQAEDRANGVPLPPSQFPFPNYDAGPLRPLPDYLNFYGINDHYPDYLQCEYNVDVKNYSRSDESGWFKASLEQIRQLGPKKFPPIKWVAVIIVNCAEWHGASTFAQAHKVGAIFKASDIFNPSCKLSQLIAHANMDRHPFEYDTSQSMPEYQQRWLIVERYAATNSASAGPK